MPESEELEEKAKDLEQEEFRAKYMPKIKRLKWRSISFPLEKTRERWTYKLRKSVKRLNPSKI